MWRDGGTNEFEDLLYLARLLAFSIWTSQLHSEFFCKQLWTSPFDIRLDFESTDV
jgi:hypothetical protein